MEKIKKFVCGNCENEIMPFDGYCGNCGLELVDMTDEEIGDAVVKVVRAGKVVKLTPQQIKTKRKKAKGFKKRMSPKQKAALAKARKKAHSGSANRNRAKSMKIRNRKI